MLLLLLGVILLVQCQAQLLLEPPIAVPERTPGTVYGNGSAAAQVKIEAFLDLNCPDSRRAWPVLKRLASSYEHHEVVVIIHQFPLPYHRNAFLCSQGFFAVKNNDLNNKNAHWKYMDAIYANIGRFGSAATEDLTTADVRNMLSLIAMKAVNIDKPTFTQELQEADSDTRAAWKFATRRGVAGTPWYIVNGVDLSLSDSVFVSFEDWRRVINTLLSNVSED